MATVIQGIPALNTAHLHRGFRILGRAFMAWRGERTSRAAVLRALDRLDDRDLRDLGLSSYDFKAIANGSLRR